MCQIVSLTAPIRHTQTRFHVNREKRNPGDWRTQVRRRWCARLAGSMFRCNQREVRLSLTSIDGSSLVAWSAMRLVSQTRSLTEPTYLFVISTFSTLPNDGALRSFTYSLQDGCLACICPSYDKHSEPDIQNSKTGLFRVHSSDALEEQRVALIDLIPSSIDRVNPVTNAQFALSNRHASARWR